MWRKVLYPLILLKLCSFSFCYRDLKFEENLANLQYDEVLREEILAWWEDYKLGRSSIRNGTRVFPLCLGRTENGDYPPSLHRWAAILDDISLKNEQIYDRTQHLYSNSPKTDIKKILMYGIQGEVDDEGKDKVQFNLVQWLHFHLVLKRDVAGILVQPLAGPLGLPGGEFRNIACQKHPNYLLDGGSIEPCTFLPRSAHTSPNVYLYDGKPTSEVFFNFNWNEAQCHETGFFQFIIIITNTFQPGDYEIKLSRLFWFSSPTLETGVFTPAYGGLSNYTCSTAVSITEVDVRLFPNREYDECVSKGKGRENGTSEWSWTCPPGPFQCSTSWKTNRDWVDLRDLVILRMTKFDREEYNLTDCCEIGELPLLPLPPPTLAPEEKKEKELEVRTVEAEIKSKVTHGGLSIFTFLVLIPLADHTARFYKDFPDLKSWGLGIWIIVHVLFHCTALVLIWCSFGLVIGTGENSLGDVSIKHFVLGILAIAIQHVGFYTAFKLSKNIKESKAFKFLAAHSLGGRLAQATAFGAIVLSSANYAMKGFSFLLVCIHIATFGVGMYYEHKQHDILGVKVHRARCPVLQRIIMKRGAYPPMAKQKVVIIVMMAGLLFGVFVFMELLFRGVMD